jgi:hypothetical protein
VLASLFKSKVRLEAENAALRHQLIVLRRTLRGRVRLTNHDRCFFVQLYRWFPSILTVLTIIRPATLVGWHRAGFRCYWRWKSRRRGSISAVKKTARAKCSSAPASYLGHVTERGALAELRRKQCQELANFELPKEIDWSMFEGLDFETMASRPRQVGRPKRLER